MPTKIKMADVKVDGGAVTVGGAGGTALANSLVQKNSVTMGELADKFGLIHPEQISIGTDGAVRINNASVASKVAKMSTEARAALEGDSGFFDTNCGCGGGGGGTSSW